MKHLYILVAAIILFSSCKQKEEVPKEWKLSNVVQLEGVNPIGIAELDGKLWLSDGDHNRLVQIDEKGNIEKTIDSLDRPMHIDAMNSLIYIPEYGADAISFVHVEDSIALSVAFEDDKIIIAPDSLDAPAAVSVFKPLNKEGKVSLAIADFYNNRILFMNEDDEEWIFFGKEGKKQGEFYYPTDVQITDSLIWVADAYNNRIQAFDKQGNFVKMMGQDQKMNAATGLFVSEAEVFITDFENNRVLVFDHDGQLKQELKEGIAKATDVLIKDGVLHIINYRTSELVLYELHEIKE
ncbi:MULTISPECIES: NHL repeat-containing protein [unclassified Croceitalea]|uniref:NHL repeat-containing protein n=1 Tax=unclassified Croceitalea TaxID=2632280 RepID=UPI0030D6E3D5